MNKGKWIRILVVLCVVSVIGMVGALRFGGKTEAFVPPTFDPTAQSGIPEVPAGLGYRELDTGAFRMALCGQITREEGAALVYLTNPAENDVWLKLRVLDANGHILGETGLTRPGEFVRLTEINPIPESGTELVLKVMAYEPDTYHSRGAVTIHARMGD